MILIKQNYLLHVYNSLPMVKLSNVCEKENDAAKTLYLSDGILHIDNIFAKLSPVVTAQNNIDSS